MSPQRTPLPMNTDPLDQPTDTAPEPAPSGPCTGPLTGEQIEQLKDRIIAVLCTCFDPEIPINIYELGLIYDLTISPEAEIHIRMTLTSPACPVAGTLPEEVRRKVQTVVGIRSVTVELVWDPPWDKSRLSEAAKLQLGLDD